MLLAARQSIAFSSASDSGNATLLDGASAAESPSPEPSSCSDAAMDILSSAGNPNEMLGHALSEDPANSPGNARWCDVLEEREARGDVLGREALTVILNSPWPWAEVALNYIFLCETEELDRSMATPPPPPPPFAEEVSGAQHHDGHGLPIWTWLIHERCFSVLIAQVRKWPLPETRAGSHH